VVLDIVPSSAAESAEGIEAEPPATAQPPGDAKQPAAPAPQIPTPAQPVAEAGTVIGKTSGKLEPPQQPADPPRRTERDSGPLHT